jgi:hypothetical protein
LLLGVLLGFTALATFAAAEAACVLSESPACEQGDGDRGHKDSHHGGSSFPHGHPDF